MNTAWALGNMAGPALAGTIADAAGDGLPYSRRGALRPHARGDARLMPRTGNRSSTHVASSGRFE